MKTLVTCSPKEFLVQTNKIRHYVKEWLSLTKILEIRKNLPKVDKDATPEDRKKAFQDQVQKNMTAILDSILEEHPDETAELMGLLCFIDPDDLENHKMSEIFGGVAECISCPEVVSFFASLMASDRRNTSAPAKASD